MPDLDTGIRDELPVAATSVDRVNERAEKPNPSVDAEDSATHEPSEVSYDEQFYPARPRRLRPRARLRLFARRPKEQIGKPSGDNEHYVSWLVDQSMLADATEFARKLSGQGSMWQNPFANPDAAGGDREDVGLVHRVPDLDDHQARVARSSARSATRTCGRRSRPSASTVCTPAR